MPVLTLPQLPERYNAPSYARHVVEASGKWEDQAVCRVKMQKHPSLPGHYGVCEHGYVVRTFDFPLEEAERLAETP